MLEYRSNLHVNERQKIRHYCARSTLLKNNKKECQMAIFLLRAAHVNCYYGDVIHTFNWKSAVEHDGGV